MFVWCPSLKCALWAIGLVTSWPMSSSGHGHLCQVVALCLFVCPPPSHSCVNRTTFVKYMRSVKKVTLKLIETFADKCDDPTLIATRFVPAMMDPVLGDYARAVPDARCVEVWTWCGEGVRRVGGRIRSCPGYVHA